MSIVINFLGAAVPLTKAFTLEKDGSLTKEAYPLVSNVTSYAEEIKGPVDLFQAIKRHALEGHCMLKGDLTRPLNNESRRGTTRTDGATKFICLDFDRFKCTNIDEALTRFGLGDVSYVMQYSASHGMPGTEGTISAHVFMLLSDAVAAPQLKAALMHINLTHLREDLRLSRTQTVISWPLDITTCQNDKLLYIATPSFRGMDDPLTSRITLVPKKLKAIPVERLIDANINVLKVEERKVLNELRKRIGLPTRTAKTSWVGACEVQNKPDACQVTGIREQGEFVRLNINHGDSWAYWHPKNNFELIHDYKSDAWYKTKELLPGYYSELVEARAAKAATPTENGDLVLAFRDLRSSEYYNGLWNPSENKLELHRARNETQLDHWMRSHGLAMGEFIPIWELCYDPLSDWRVDAPNHAINLFESSPYYYLEADPDGQFPAIASLIKHMLGIENGLEDLQLYEHFLNWLAVVFQRKGTSSGHTTTAWVTQGVQGTGKGSFFAKVITPLFGKTNVFAAGVTNIEDGFNGWLHNKLFVMIEECDVDDFKEKGRVSAKLKVYITDEGVPIRQMRQAASYVPNYTSFMFASNKKQAVHIEASDRRYNVGNFQKKMLKYPGDAVIDSELEAFAKFLLAHKADAEKANTVLQTKARERIQKLGISSVEETCRNIVNGDFDALWMTLPDETLLNESGIRTAHSDNAQAYTALMKRLFHEAVDFPENTLSRDEILCIMQYNVGQMPVTPNKFTSLLRHHGIETVQIRRNGQKTFGIPVHWTISDDLCNELLKNPRKSKVRAVKNEKRVH